MKPKLLQIYIYFGVRMNPCNISSVYSFFPVIFYILHEKKNENRRRADSEVSEIFGRKQQRKRKPKHTPANTPPTNQTHHLYKDQR